MRQSYVHGVHVVIQQQALMRFPSIIACTRIALAHVNAMLFSVSGESLRVPTRDRHKLGALDALERRGKAMRDRARAQNTPANAFHKASHLLKAYACHDTRPRRPRGRRRSRSVWSMRATRRVTPSLYMGKCRTICRRRPSEVGSEGILRSYVSYISNVLI